MTPWNVRFDLFGCPWLSCSSNSWISAPSKPLTLRRPFCCSSKRSKGPSKLGASWSNTEGSGHGPNGGSHLIFHLFFKRDLPAMLQCSLCMSVPTILPGLPASP